MPSSIFSFELSRRARTSVMCMVIGAATIAVLVGVSHKTAPSGAWQMDIVTHGLPPREGSYYLAYDRGSNIEHHVLYHGSDRVALDQMRRADVLFLGNSRLMFALHRPTLRRFFQELALTYYVVGFGHNERDDFPERIIRDHDLRPSVVVVNVDGFFWDDQSAVAAKAITDSPFDTWKLQREGEAAHAVRRRLHSAVPHYVDLRSGTRELVIYRSRLDGTWFVANELGEGGPFPWPSEDRHEPSERSLRSARSFTRAMEERGVRVILCLVPAPNVSIHRAQRLAAHIGVPLVIPVVENLKTIDGSHLSATSAFRFEQALLTELRSLLRARSHTQLK